MKPINEDADREAKAKTKPPRIKLRTLMLASLQERETMIAQFLRECEKRNNLEGWS